MRTRKKPSGSDEPKLFNNFRSFCNRMVKSAFRTGIVCTIFLMTFAGHSAAQSLDVPYVPTPNDVLERMLDLANVGSSDYVIDLGSGDGRIVIAAAKRGAVGHGVDLDPERVTEARENAESEGVSDRVMFMEGDIFETDFSKASVITLYLLSSVNRELRPLLFENLRPGTRVVSHSFDMGDWEPDNAVEFANRDLYFWVIPAELEGGWQWKTNGEPFSMTADQEFQEISVELSRGNQTLTTEESTLRGERINLIAEDEENNARYIFSGFVEGGTINGTVQVHENNSAHIEEWSATLSK